MKVTIENFPKDIVKVNTKSFPKGLQDEIKTTLDEPNEYGITWSEYLDVSDSSFLELLVSKVNEAIEKDNKPKAEPKVEPKSKNKPLKVSESEKEKVKYQEWFQKVKKVEEQKLEFTDSQINKLNEFDKNHNFYENLNHLAKFTKNKTVIDAANYSLKTWVKNGSKLQTDMRMEDLILSKIKVSKANEAIEKDNKPKAEPNTASKPKAKGKAKSTPQPSTTTPQPKSIYADLIKEVEKVKVIKLDLRKDQTSIFRKNSAANNHTENVVYLTVVSNNETLKKASKFSKKQWENDGSLLKENREFQELILSKLDITYYEEPEPSKSKSNKKTEAEKEKEAVAKKEIVKEKLEKENKELFAKVKANAKLKAEITKEVNSYLNANGLAGKPDKKPLTLDEKIKMLKEKKHFYTNLLAGDKADFKAIGKRIGLSYRTSSTKPKGKNEKLADAIVETVEKTIEIKPAVYDIEFSLESRKMEEVTKKQYEYLDKLAYKTGSSIPNTSQTMKYCSRETISDAIDAMKNGKKIKLS